MTELLSRTAAAWPLVIKRSLAHWRLLSTVVVGVLMASAIMSGTVTYFDALRDLALRNTLSQLTTTETDILVKADRGPTSYVEYGKVRDAMEAEFDDKVAWMLGEVERGGKTSTFFMTEPGDEASAGEDDSRAYFAFLPSLYDNITIVDGKPPEPDLLPGDNGVPVLEALVPFEAATAYGVGVGDRLSAVPFWADAVPHVGVVISGLFERTDPGDRLWSIPDTFFDPTTTSKFRTLPFYLTEHTYMTVLGATMRNMDSSYSYVLGVDTRRLNPGNTTTARANIRLMERRLAAELFSFRQITDLDRALTDYDQRLFFSKIPMFVILVLISVVILYYVVTLSSLLVEQQRGEISLLRSRGTSSAQVLAVFVLEGGTITLLAIIVAPILAAIAISLLGFTPAFADLSGLQPLPVRLTGAAYGMGALGGLLSFAALMVPAVQASRIGVTRHRQEEARPSEQPLFQRYYLDVMLLLIGLILFRQLSEQGSVVATNLLGGAVVSQVLLAVPAVILVALAMVLLRLFPLAIRFLSGDSAALLHLVVGGSLAFLIPSIAVSEAFGAGGLSWLPQTALLAGAGVVYWVAQRYEGLGPRIAAAILEAGLIAGALVTGPELPLDRIFTPLLVAVPPAGVVFHLLRAFSHRAPVGFSMGLWQMARNPTHYARLSLLLILMTGLGIFAASFGGTLKQSFQERALYAVGSDIRLGGVLLTTRGVTEPVVESYEDIPGVEAATPVVRAFGTDLSRLLGERYTMFAMDGEVLPGMAEFRADFTPRPIEEMVRELSHRSTPTGITLPADARSLNVRVKASRAYRSVVLDARMRDANGRYFTYPVGMLDSRDWAVLSTSLRRTNSFSGLEPLRPQRPLTLVSLSIEELNGRNTLRSGTVAIDEVSIITSGGEKLTLENFQDTSEWSVLRVTPQSESDGLQPYEPGGIDGDGAALFTWSEGSPRSSRGIYHGPEVSPLPVLASRSFVKKTGHGQGNVFDVSVSGHRVPVQIMELIDFFPTLDTYNEIYLLSDQDSLVRYTNLDASSAEVRPNEIWLTTNGDPAERASLLGAIRDDVPFPARTIHDREAVLTQALVDPLVDAGWRALLFMAFGAVLVLSCIGFLVHAYVSFKERETQFGLMRTIGFSLRQLTVLVWVEQALVIAAGMVLGSWMGERLGAIVMPFLSHNDRGGRVLPPFVLQIDWPALAITYGAMVAVFAVIILGVIWFIRRISLQRILRLGEM